MKSNAFKVLIAAVAAGAIASRCRRARPSVERPESPASLRPAPPPPVKENVRPSLQPVVRPPLAPAGSINEVHFGASGAKKNRNKRMMARLGAVALIATLLGLPGVNLIDLVGDRITPEGESLTKADLGGVTTTESAEGMMRLRGDLFQSRPKPTPTPTEEPTPEPAPEPEVEAEAAAPVEAPPAPSGSITEILYGAAAEFGLDGSYLVSVASCESGLNPGAVNPAGYHGLFQFSESTWASYGYGSIYDPVAQARTAARMLAAGMASHWPNCA